MKRNLPQNIEILSRGGKVIARVEADNVSFESLSLSKSLSLLTRHYEALDEQAAASTFQGLEIGQCVKVKNQKAQSIISSSGTPEGFPENTSHMTGVIKGFDPKTMSGNNVLVQFESGEFWGSYKDLLKASPKGS